MDEFEHARHIINHRFFYTHTHTHTHMQTGRETLERAIMTIQSNADWGAEVSPCLSLLCVHMRATPTNQCFSSEVPS